MPVRQARSETRGRPPFGRRGGIGKNGSTRSHNGSGSSVAAIAVYATSPKGIKFQKSCYTLFYRRMMAFRASSDTTSPSFLTRGRYHGEFGRR